MLFDSIDKPVIYLITEGGATTDNFAEKKSEILRIVRLAVESNISLIQIREKKISARLVFKLVGEVVKITRGSRTKVLVNDRADIAFAAKADGVHLTSDSVSAEVVRRCFPKNFIIGVSAHTLETAAKAARNKADFAAFSPIFPTPNKGKPQTLETLREVCEKLKPFPIIALGGIDETNYKSVLENGASGFAAIRFLNDAENLEKFF